MVLNVALALTVVAIAIATRPWRALPPQGPPWVWIVAWALPPWLWSADPLAQSAPLPPLSRALALWRSDAAAGLSAGDLLLGALAHGPGRSDHHRHAGVDLRRVAAAVAGHLQRRAVPAALKRRLRAGGSRRRSASRSSAPAR